MKRSWWRGVVFFKNRERVENIAEGRRGVDSMVMEKKEGKMKDVLLMYPTLVPHTLISVSI